MLFLWYITEHGLVILEEKWKKKAKFNSHFCLYIFLISHYCSDSMWRKIRELWSQIGFQHITISNLDLKINL